MTNLTRTYLRILTYAIWSWSAFVPCMLVAQTRQDSVCGLVIDLFGNPIDGATLEAPATVGRSTTKPNGKFCLQDLPPGDTLLSVAFPGFGRQQKMVKSLAGKTALADFVLAVGRLTDPPKRTVTGVIMGEQEKPLVGARLVATSWFDTSIGSETVSDGGGKFMISLPEPGQYCVRAWTVGHRTSVDVITVPPGTEPSEIQLQLTLRRFSFGSQ